MHVDVTQQSKLFGELRCQKSMVLGWEVAQGITHRQLELCSAQLRCTHWSVRNSGVQGTDVHGRRQRVKRDAIREDRQLLGDVFNGHGLRVINANTYGVQYRKFERKMASQLPVENEKRSLSLRLRQMSDGEIVDTNDSKFVLAHLFAQCIRSLDQASRLY